MDTRSKRRRDYETELSQKKARQREILSSPPRSLLALRPRNATVPPPMCGVDECVAQLVTSELLASRYNDVYRARFGRFVSITTISYDTDRAAFLEYIFSTLFTNTAKIHIVATHIIPEHATLFFLSRDDVKQILWIMFYDPHGATETNSAIESFLSFYATVFYERPQTSTCRFYQVRFCFPTGKGPQSRARSTEGDISAFHLKGKGSCVSWTLLFGHLFLKRVLMPNLTVADIQTLYADTEIELRRMHPLHSHVQMSSVVMDLVRYDECVVTLIAPITKVYYALSALSLKDLQALRQQHEERINPPAHDEEQPPATSHLIIHFAGTCAGYIASLFTTAPPQPPPTIRDEQYYINMLQCTTSEPMRQEEVELTLVYLIACVYGRRVRETLR